MGVYRSSPSGNETMAYNVKAPDLSYGSTAAAAKHGAPTASSSPAPTPAPTPSATPDTDQSSAGGRTLIGGGINDTIIGTTGNDTIFGKSGTDLLTGGDGSDKFVFDTRLDVSSRVDSLVDFDVDDDMIVLDSSIFTSLWQGELGDGVFRAGRTALDHNDHVLYDRASGLIAYDADGAGGDAAVAFARVAPGTELTHQHFFII
jgi:Ca2+-binding RTX toxin-like protein